MSIRAVLASPIPRFLAYLGYLALLFLAVDYGFYRHYLSELKRCRPKQATLAAASDLATTHASLGLWNSVGYISTPRTPGRYFLFPEEKPPGIIRIGAFGDSYTYGDEAGVGLDYPSQLQRLFERAGARNVQVLNFGNDWHGFHQTFRIWDQLGRRYHLDFILLGPGTFFDERDETFNHALPELPYYLHGRYVLDGNGLRFIDVVGRPNDLDDRFARYFSFFPRWDYLRYDTNPPMFLESLVPAGRTLENPFYYRKGRERDEVQKVREILLEKMEEGGSQVILALADGSVINIARRVGSILALPIGRWYRFPYFRTEHYGAIGYKEIARAFFSALTGAGALEHYDLKFRDQSVEDPTSRAAPKHPIHGVSVELAGHPIGELSLVTSPHDDRQDNHPIDPAKRRIQSFFTIRGSDESALDGYWSGLDFRPSPGDPVSLEFGSGSNRKLIPLGRVRFLDRSEAFGYLVFDEIWRHREAGNEDQVLPGYFLALEGVHRESQPSGVLTVAGHPVLKMFWSKEDLELSSLTGPLFKFRASRDMNLDLSQLPHFASVQLKLLEGQQEQTVPIGEAEVIQQSQPYLRKSGQRYIEIGYNGHGMIVRYRPEKIQ